MAVVSLFSFTAFFYGSDKARRASRRLEKKPVRFGGSTSKSPVKRLQSNLSNKAMFLAKMISWRKVHSDGGDEEKVEIEYGFDDDEEEAVWRKTIIKGEKCRPWDFSGKILYDADGNLVPDDHHLTQS